MVSNVTVTDKQQSSDLEFLIQKQLVVRSFDYFLSIFKKGTIFYTPIQILNLQIYLPSYLSFSHEVQVSIEFKADAIVY